MRVIGTAGHVDHGKSALVAALTGVHPDRLKEEQEREMTIELGFGWLQLPSVGEVGIVDVPGHRDFIENMLAGVGAIDAALLVVAADEGVMPQTREHLAILNLLQIPAGLIVLTKLDLAADAAWLELVEADIRAAAAGTVLDGAVCMRVSAKTGEGVDVLRGAIDSLLAPRPARPDLGRPRLPVDRVFSMPGFGTVVTGTLTAGSLRVGDEIELLPSGRRGRIRGLQAHKRAENEAGPGSRTAVNISGIETAQIARGDVVVRPGQYQPTRRLDAQFQLLSSASKPLRHGSLVKFFVGASEAMATARVLGVDELTPGSDGFIQLELRTPVVTVRGDRYILRQPSPGETLGGGQVIDHQPRGRHRRFSKDVLSSLERMAEGSPTDVLLEAALALNAAPAAEVVERSRLEAGQATSALEALLEDGRLMALEDKQVTATSDVLVVAASQWRGFASRALQIVSSYHAEFALRGGIQREELKSRLQLSTPVFAAAVKRLLRDEALVEHGGTLAVKGHTVKFDGSQQARSKTLLLKFEQNPYSPPSVKECQAEVGDEIYSAMIVSGQLTAVSTEVVFRKSDYDTIVGLIRDALVKKQQITLAEVRDLLDTSRKYVQAVLEHLDASGVTIRDGDFRRLRR
jgi:selenocysteine-specific elongation factor